MSGQPTISVLVTSYNREGFIAQAVESVLAQTFTDFELIVVDDCSTDRTVEIVERYLADPRVRLERNQSNLGDYPNRNRAATFACGAFLKYHDSDDVMYPHCLATMVKPLMAEPRAGFALSGSSHWPGGPCPMLLTPRMAYQREFLGTGLFHLGPASAMFRADAFRELGGFPAGGVASDYLFWMKAFARVAVLLVPGDLFYYRIHAGQELADPRAELDYAKASGVTWDILSSPECPLDGEEREQAKRNWAFTVARGVYRRMKRGQFEAALAVARHSHLRAIDWLRYLRPARRSAFVGTPELEQRPL